METYVVRVWLPDRPGALGQVASRIGAVHGDVVGIEILERGGGSVIDELIVTLPDDQRVDLLVSEIREVDGAAVEDIRPLHGTRVDGAVATLTTAAAIVKAPPGERLETVCRELRTLLEADWVVVMTHPDAEVVAHSGEPPVSEWVGAYLAGSEHLDGNASEGISLSFTPGDLVSARLPRHAMAIACGRAGRVFHARESEEVRILASIVDAID